MAGDVPTIIGDLFLSGILFFLFLPLPKASFILRTKVRLSQGFNKKSVAIYNKDGKLVETVSNTNGKLAYTGNVVNVVVLATTVVALVAVSAVVARKRIVNA